MYSKMYKGRSKYCSQYVYGSILDNETGIAYQTRAPKITRYPPLLPKPEKLRSKFSTGQFG
jgi:hypothetical protein